MHLCIIYIYIYYVYIYYVYIYTYNHNNISATTATTTNNDDHNIYIYKCILYLIISPSHTINQYLDMSLFFKHFQPYKGDIGGSIFQD